MSVFTSEKFDTLYLDFISRFTDPRTPRFPAMRRAIYEDADPIKKIVMDYPRRSRVNVAKIRTEAAPLAQEYKLDQGALLKLLVEMALIAGDVGFGSGPSVRSTRSKIAKLQKILSSSTPVLEEIVQDEAACHALKEVSGEVPLLVLYLLTFVNVLHAAANAPVKLGRGSHAPWRQKATKLCMAFWREQKHQKPTVNFETVKRTTVPISPFSCWFCRVMTIADPSITTSNCYSLLRQK